MGVFSNRIIRPIRNLVATLNLKSEIKHDDVFLVSFPKSGNTWISFIIANLMSLDSGKNIDVNFFNLIDFIPEYPNHIKNLNGIRWGRFPRIIKSHELLNNQFNKVFLIIRDPRDVMVSYYFYSKNLGNIPNRTTISDFIRSNKFGIESWVSHTHSWLSRASTGKRVQCFLYENFIKDPKKEVLGMLHILGIKLENSIIEGAIRRSTKDKMRFLEETTRSSNIRLYDTNFQFVRKGEIGEGSKLNRDDLEFIREKAIGFAKGIGYNLDFND